LTAPENLIQKNSQNQFNAEKYSPAQIETTEGIIYVKGKDGFLWIFSFYVLYSTLLLTNEYSMSKWVEEGGKHWVLSSHRADGCSFIFQFGRHLIKNLFLFPLSPAE
jgi:hypothetical protein